MSFNQDLNQELQRISAIVGGDTLAVDVPAGRLTAEILAVDAIGCSTSAVTFATPQLAKATVHELKKVSDDLSHRLNYLLEPISLIEADAELATVQMRSNPPQKDDDGTRYYELLVRRGGELSLVRYQKLPGQPRQPVPAHLTREVFVKLAGDLVAAVP